MLPAGEVLSTSILGPWVRTSQAAARRQQVYLTLSHWYEAAKFMPHKPELRDAVLFNPTIKEARKFARKCQESWRSDWPLTRHSVLVAGLGMLTIQRPELGLDTWPLTQLKASLAPLELPERFLDACLERFDSWRQAPRIAVFGAEVAPEAVVGARLAKLVSPLPTWTLITSCHRRAPWRVHDWALSHYVPVEYLGRPSDRASRSLAQEIIAAADHVIVFEQRKAKRFDHVIQVAKTMRRKLFLELYDAEQTAGQLAIA